MDLQPVGMPAALASRVEPTHPERSPAPRVKVPAAPETAMAARIQVAIDRASGSMSRDLDISSDPSTQRIVLRVVDHATGEVVRQFPSPEALAIAQDIDRQRGQMLRQAF